MILHIQGVIVGQVRNAVVSKAVAAKLLGIGIEHYLVRACGHHGERCNAL